MTAAEVMRLPEGTRVTVHTMDEYGNHRETRGELRRMGGLNRIVTRDQWGVRRAMRVRKDDETAYTIEK